MFRNGLFVSLQFGKIVLLTPNQFLILAKFHKLSLISKSSNFMQEKTYNSERMTLFKYSTVANISQSTILPQQKYSRQTLWEIHSAEAWEILVERVWACDTVQCERATLLRQTAFGNPPPPPPETDHVLTFIQHLWLGTFKWERVTLI